MIWSVFWCGNLHYVLWKTEWFSVWHCFPLIPVINLVKEINKWHHLLFFYSVSHTGQHLQE